MCVCVCSVTCTKTLMMRAAENRMLGKVGVCKLWTVLQASNTYSTYCTSRIQRSVFSSPAVSCGNISCFVRNGTGRWEGSLKPVLNRMCVRPFRNVC